MSDTLLISAIHIYVALGLLDGSSLLGQTHNMEFSGVAQDPLLATVDSPDGFHLPARDVANPFCCPSSSLDGTYVASPSGMSTIRIWRANATAPIAIIETGSRIVWTQFIPDSTHIVCGSVDLTVTIWEVERVELVMWAKLGGSSTHHRSCEVRYAADAGFKVLGVLLNGRVLFWDTRDRQPPMLRHPRSSFLPRRLPGRGQLLWLKHCAPRVCGVFPTYDKAKNEIVMSVHMTTSIPIKRI